MLISVLKKYRMACLLACMANDDTRYSHMTNDEESKSIPQMFCIFLDISYTSSCSINQKAIFCLS